MSILNKIALKNIKLNKKRSISTIIGVILSVALLCAVTTMAESFRRTMINSVIDTNGYYHLSINNITKEDINKIALNRNVKEIYSVNDIGVSLLEGSKNEYKPYVNLYSMSKNAFDNLKFNIIKGRFPANNNEIIISSAIIDNGGVRLDIGDTITFDVGTRKTLDNYDLNSSNLYYPGHEQIVNTTNYTFKVVGIIERPSYTFEGTQNLGYTVITTNMNSLKKKSFIILKDPKKKTDTFTQILGPDYNRTPKYKSFFINNNLIKYETMDFSEGTLAFLYTSVIIVTIIIIFTSIFCIRNSFAISILEKTKMYGMLSSVGATKKQIKNHVIYEGMLLAVVGIPLGIILGLVADYIIIIIVNMIIKDIIGTSIVFVPNIISCLIAVILGIITIYLSSISSAKKASKVSPINNLKNNNDIKITTKKLRTPKYIKKLFGIGGILAYKNLKRSKKKYRTTVISLVVSIVLFITVSAFIHNVFAETNIYYTKYDYNIVISNHANVNLITKENLDDILRLDNIEYAYINYSGKSFVINDDNMVNYDESEREKANIKIIGLDKESFKKYAKKIGANYDKIKSTGILVDKYVHYDNTNKKYIEKRRYKYKKGDTITGIYGDDPMSIKVGAVTDIHPYGYEGNAYYNGYLVVEETLIKDLEISYINIYSNSPDKLEADIKEYSNNIAVVNFNKDVRQNNSIILVINIFLYGFITVITLIGVTNIFNTITSNMELRQQEFAVLKSTGMTKKEFNRMITLETIFYCSKALIYGIILGLLTTFLLYLALSINLEKDIYIPYIPILVSIIAVFILVFIIMKYSINKINKQNIIETIRKDNI